MVRNLVVFTSLAACAAASAQPVYKCSVDGRVSYEQQPCTSGTQATLAVAPAPTPDPDLKERMARQKALADSFDQERSKAALRPARQQAARAAPQQAQRCDKLRLQLRWAEEDLRKAAGPGTEALRLKARRQAEAMAVECRR